MGLEGEIKSYGIHKKDLDGAKIRKRRRKQEPVIVEIYADGSVVVHGRKRLQVAVIHRLDVQTGAAEILTEELALRGVSQRHRKIYGMIRATGNTKECVDVEQFVKTEMKLELVRKLEDADVGRTEGD